MSSSPHNNPHDGAGGYTSDRRRSFQPSPGSQQRLAELPALSDATRVNQELVHGYDLAYRPQSSIDTPIDYYAGTSSHGNYGTTQQYQEVHGPAYPHHTQGAVPIPYASSQSTRNIYPQPGVTPHWTPGQHHLSAEFHRSASWPQHHSSHSGSHMSSVPSLGSTSVTQIRSNSRTGREVDVPQRPYIPHHRQNYFDQFIAENPITFCTRSGRQGIAITDVMSENFDHLWGRDDPMFANYTGPAISLRLEWPGYKSWTKQIKTKDWRREPKPITKAKLAIEVAKKVQNFIQDNVGEPITHGWEKWRVGPGFMEVNDLVLVRLVHVSKGSWQAEFRAIE